MTYLSFLALFLGLPLIGAALALRSAAVRRQKLPDALRGATPWMAVVAHILLSVAYTTLWDNYLIFSGVWWYDPARVAGWTLGWAPVEEYSFFVLQSLLAGLWVLWLARRVAPAETVNPKTPVVWALLGLLALWLCSAALLAVGYRPGRYLALILVWAIPPIALQTAFGARTLWRYRRPALLAWGSLTLYLSLADSLAIGAGIWTIDPLQTTGWLLLGVLPVEEALFFAATNALVVFGVILALSVESWQRYGFLAQRKPT